MSETVGFAILVAGCVLAAVGLLWLLLRAFRTSLLWGVGSLLVPPVLIAFVVVHFRRVRLPLFVYVLGLLVLASPLAINRLIEPPKEAVTTTTTGGDKSGTLTGAADTEVVAYLKANRDAAVLQMADRADVTDAVLLDHVAGMPNLRELDLNGTPVTDAGLAVLATLPKLEALRVARTKVTADGVAKHVLSSATIKSVDVGGLGVSAKALREWKNADPQARKYVN